MVWWRQGVAGPVVALGLENSMLAVQAFQVTHDPTITSLTFRCLIMKSLSIKSLVIKGLSIESLAINSPTTTKKTLAIQAMLHSTFMSKELSGGHAF